MDEILERVSWRTTKASMHFSLRYLIEYGLIQKMGHEFRRGRNRAIYEPTNLGREYFATKSQPVVKDVDADPVLTNLSEIEECGIESVMPD